MHTQQLLPICGLLLASIAIASKLDRDDVPNRCWPACSSVVGIAKSCDAKYERDSAEIQCICDWDAAKTEIPLCSACITQYQTDRRNHNITHHDDDNDDDDDDDNDDDNEALDLVRSCSLTTTTYSAAATTLIGTSTSTESTSTATSSTATITDSSSTSGGSQDSTSSVSSGSSDSAGASSGSASSPTPTPDAAASISAPGATSMLGFMGLMAFAWL
ncbi:hypothetical protein DTO013E5_6162 [Penicillium roqueforti]|nr:hypothetical protein CBS147337_6646 [Penicillium roqueforti]KAI2695785.1 hypothetical protein CBS147372_8894 [Penicillium roqueforti]KAI2696908.1 hypothetical protein CBS147332_8871 [Penicillium roqueforti]KAI2713235.1 hypothetical protein CBS147354_7675 [Penicillium roqueforti]KAI2714419.1 hypothetical protein CBS147318_6573 [Penicillium roqueforti]